MQWLSENWVWLIVPIVFFLLMRRGGMGCGTPSHRHAPADPEQERDSADRGETSESATDGITGTPLDRANAVTSVYQGQVYYFSSKENRDTFEAAPERYAKPPNASARQHRHHGGCC